ncbi:MAG: ribonuclease Z [Syntrophorhabdaceae bacterium]|nr:ribonuclease Z [Syntrophorhabdaceae bacterium]
MVSEQMKLLILGSGTATPSIRRLSSSYLLTTERHNILIDIGPSVVRRLIEFGYSINGIDVIILTHFHIDHTADLSTFLFASNYGDTERSEPLTILGGDGIYKFYRALRNLYPWVKPINYELNLINILKSDIQLFGIKIKAMRMNHNRESIGISVEGKKKVVFSGDTDYSKNLIKLSRDAELLIVECSFPERKLKGHMNLQLVNRITQEAKPKRVILTHLYPQWDEFKGIIPRPYLLAEDGMEIEL